MCRLLCIVMVGLLVVSGCAPVGRRVVVEPGPPGLRPWQRPYSVDGRRYVPLLRADGYREEGFASWYGREEHGGLTSNGEIFDMYQLTAAHKTLPLGCRLRVTNKVNGRQVVVRVNDRGPFVDDRVVDLSYQAALHLDMVGSGISPVLLEAVAGGEHAVAPGTGAAPAGIYAVQVAACTDRQEARKIAARLVEQQLVATVQEVNRGSESLFRVRTGSFRTRGEAEELRRFLAGNGFPDVFIVVR